MYFKTIIMIILLFASSCKEASQSGSSINTEKNVVLANEFIDAFYSFNRNRLDSVLSYAEKSKPSILYYQGWAEGGNYEIIERHQFVVKNDSLVICPITVKDDLIAVLEIDFWVTDTFHITIKNRHIISVRTSSNDPPIYLEADEWVRKNRSQLIEEPCQDAWEGGPTPGECARAMLKGYEDFMNYKKNN